MIKALTALGLGAAILTGVASAQSSETSDQRQIMILGTFHFTGGENNYIPNPVDDFLSERRQAEIQEVVSRLEAFNPTKIAVEVRHEAEEDFNADYRAYRAGEHDLSANESQQIGMRLAHRLGHDTVYAVDYRNGMDIPGLFEKAQENEQTDILNRLNALRDAQLAEQDVQSAPGRTVLERLIHANQPASLDDHDVYLTLAQIGSRDDLYGAEQMANWWGRNLRIFAGIAMITEPGDRVLVIYGSGHKFLLDQFVDGSAEHELIDPLAYLEG